MSGFPRPSYVLTTIKNNVWIGANVTILAGSEIEPNVIVAAGAVVRGRVKEGFIYGGIPARPLTNIQKEISSDVEELRNRISWLKAKLEDFDL